MKTKQFSGFQLLDLHDFPGQGTALVGLLDAFWDSKGLIEASAFRQFCAPVVPLARFAKAVYSGDEMFSASIEVVNYSNAAIDNKQIMWQLHGTWKARFRNLLHAPGHIQCNFFDLITQLLWHLCKYRNDIIGFSALNYSYNRTFPTSLISIY